MAVIWERSGRSFHGTNAGTEGEARFHLIVEPLGNRWDWEKGLSVRPESLIEFWSIDATSDVLAQA
jgi:hypothetical protein